MNRRTLNSEDRALEQEIKRSLSVSSYLDNVYEAIMTGNANAAKANVPDYSNNVGNLYRHESSGLPIDMEGLFQSSADALGAEGIQKAIATTYPPRHDGKTTFSRAQTAPAPSPAHEQKTANATARPGAMVTENQFRAIRKYPQIIEFLGTEKGAKIATQIMGEITSIVAEQIEKNTQLVHDNAKNCVAYKQYLHQFFQGPGWVCKVTASGPFRGNEAFYFKEDEDKAFVLRRFGDRYVDVSAEFNIVHDYRIVEEENYES